MKEKWLTPYTPPLWAGDPTSATNSEDVPSYKKTLPSKPTDAKKAPFGEYLTAWTNLECS